MLDDEPLVESGAMREIRDAVSVIAREFAKFDEERATWEMQRRALRARVRELEQELERRRETMREVVERNTKLEHRVEQLLAGGASAEEGHEDARLEAMAARARQRKSQRRQQALHTGIPASIVSPMKTAPATQKYHAMPALMRRFHADAQESEEAPSVASAHQGSDIASAEKSAETAEEEWARKTKSIAVHMMPQRASQLPPDSDDEEAVAPAEEEKPTPEESEEEENFSAGEVSVESEEGEAPQPYTDEAWEWATLPSVKFPEGPGEAQEVPWMQQGKLGVLKSHLDGVRAVEFLQDSPVVVSGGEDGAAKLWNVRKIMKSHKQSTLSRKDPGLTPSMQRVQLYDPNITLLRHTAPVLSLAVNEENQRVFTAGADGLVCAWRLPEQPHKTDKYSPQGRVAPLLTRVREHNDAVWSVVTQGPIGMSAAADGSLAVWSVDDNGEDDEEDSVLLQLTRDDNDALAVTSYGAAGAPLRPTRICFGDSLSQVFAGFTCGTIAHVDTEHESVVSEWRPPAELRAFRATALVAHKEQPHVLLTACSDGFVRIFDARSSRAVHVARAHTATVTGIDVSPTGDAYVSCAHDGSLRYWDMRTRACLQDISSHMGKYDEVIHCARYHPTKNVVATGGADCHVQLYGG